MNGTIEKKATEFLTLVMLIAIYGYAIYYVIQQAINAHYNAGLKIMYGIVASVLILMAIYSFAIGIKKLF